MTAAALRCTEYRHHFFVAGTIVFRQMMTSGVEKCKRLYETIMCALKCTFSFLMVSSAKIEEVFENCFILMLSTLKHEKVSQNSFVFELEDR